MSGSLQTSASPGWTSNNQYPPSDEEGASVTLLSLDDTSHETEKLPVLEGKSSLWKHWLSALCFTLHVALDLLHMVALISTMRHWEHHFTFATDQQATVSFWLTVATQTFGTGYTAILVFLTQTLTMWHNFGPNRTLTAIHDTISAWAGLGSALVSLWNQVSVPASVLGTLSIVSYLSCISILHISLPAIISVEAFNATVAVQASTLGIPEYANANVINSTRNYMTTFATGFLPFRGVFNDSQMLGVLDGTLYEVLANTTSERATAQVSALGFNISCGYVPAQILPIAIAEYGGGDNDLEVTVDGLSGSFLKGAVSLMSNSLSIYGENQNNTNNNSIYLSATTTVMDSQGNQGAPLIFAQQPPAVAKILTNFNLTSSQIQFLKCYKSTVPQSATIDATSNKILDGSLNPNVYKDHSTWIPAAELNLVSESSTLVGSGLWSEILCSVADPISTSLDDCWDVDEYLMTYLGLDPFANATSVTLKLHDIENALASVLALGFWGAGHVKVNPWYMNYSAVATSTGTQSETGTFPELVVGTATIMQQDTSRVRLNSNIAASTNDIPDRHTFDICPEDAASIEQQRQAGTNFAPGRNHKKLGIALHVLLVVVFATVLGLAAARMEHHVIFPIADQQTVSFLCKVATMVLGSIYYSALVYLTQKLAITHAAQEYSFFTATHDKVLAWSGIGSAISTLWQQVKLPGSPRKILYISIYLATISVLHIATPALVSVESFDLPLKAEFDTQRFPEWSNMTNKNATLTLLTKGAAFLPWVTNLGPALTLGLSNGSLYEVLESASLGGGSADISAVGFNVTCGYIPGLVAKDLGGAYNISSPSEDFKWTIFDLLPGKRSSL
ncbi:hypothetical protein MSAN_01756700 [Mycena sanguinolenta]|uniref:Uncharacterized protein n=1 Tax=Mycena sanguinolenta TaxID=230812 RepID=A0A8H7CUN2_9AGAR|nr:hypothetical protein MSAN_01756700 [Mycena sanguinolenta]